MAEKDADNSKLIKNDNESNVAQALSDEQPPSNTSLNDQKIIEKSESYDAYSYLPFYESPLKKEENPFSFKKFLNQDSSAQKNKGARKKVYTSESSSSVNKMDLPNINANKSHLDINSRMVNPTDVSSVLPDFVQDHLVIEQCYLSGGSSTIDIDNLNLQNLPDLNLEHRNVHFMLNSDGETNHLGQNSSDQFSSNLPDFTMGAANFSSAKNNFPNNIGLPDFTVNARSNLNDENFNFQDRSAVKNMNFNNANDASHTRQRVQISSSPSVPLDLPSYESNEAPKNSSIPFDLTIPAEETSSNNRGMTSAETVSKSLPDFLSDGPIKKELDENLQNVRGYARTKQNGLPPPEISSLRTDPERLHREIEFLRRQLSEKNRRLEILETELEHIHSTEQRETVSLEYALQDVENNLKQTAKRAVNAENLVLKLRQENKILKSEISSLKSENLELRLGNFESESSPTQEIGNHRIAKELRSAANSAENSLKSLLMGVENLRALAAFMEKSTKVKEPSKDCHDFSQEDSASGPV